jgi:hypothetical protein
VTRQIYTGRGKVFQTQDGVHYCISQRAQHIYQKISAPRPTTLDHQHARRAARRPREVLAACT